MENDLDFALALQLQEQFNAESRPKDCEILSETPGNSVPSQSKTKRPNPSSASYSNHSKEVHRPSKLVSVVDESWELVDPIPDVHSLFLQFNDTYFWGKLEGVEVRWSPRMTSCAGICCYEGRGGLCSVRLSEPLLKLRPRKDLVQTLLHEMIHAYLFVTNNNRDRDGHGPEFHEHMYRINKMSGANITVYHTFHDEVRLYKQHWWRCNGPCQNRHPFYGYVKRASNRAPAPNDFWWAEHQKTCGGQFIKIKEPENYKKKEKRAASDSAVRTKKHKIESPDIRSFFKKSPAKVLAKPTTSNVYTISPVKSSAKSPSKKSTSSVNIFGGIGHILGKK